MFPEDEFSLTEIETLSTSTTTMGKVFLFDFDTKQYTLVNGKPVEATYEQAVIQWVTFVITASTEAIYQSTDFGLNLKQYIGNRDMDRYTAESEIERLLKEKLVQHPEINAVQDISLTRDGDKTTINMTIVTNQGVISGLETEVRISG